MTQHILLYFAQAKKLCPKCKSINLWAVCKLSDHFICTKSAWNLSCSKHWYFIGFKKNVLHTIILNNNPFTYNVCWQASCYLTRELLKLKRDQLLLTGHCHLKGHLFNLKLAKSSICKRCLEKEYYHYVPIRKVLRLTRSARLTEGWTRRGSATDLTGHRARTRWILAHPLLTYLLTYIHTLLWQWLHKTSTSP
jgi:hypothetical protein